MQPGAIPFSIGIIALPNGFTSAAEGRHLRLTAFLSLTVTTPNGVRQPTLKDTPFAEWPEKLRSLQQARQSQWEAVFKPKAGGSELRFSLPTNSEKLHNEFWVAIFGTDRAVNERRGTSDLEKSWRLSPQITKLHDRHRDLKLAYASKAITAKLGRGSSDKGASLKQLGALIDTEIATKTPPELYLHPVLRESADAPNMARHLAERKAAQDWLNSIATSGIPVDQAKLLNDRISHGLELLEDTEGVRLRAIALYCLYRHCVTSIAPPGASLKTDDDGNPNFRLAELYQNVTRLAQNIAGSPDLDEPVDQYQSYIELLLFYRRKTSMSDCKIQTPDFHQMLGLIQHYPALLRPLGLACDFRLPLTPEALPNGEYTVSIENDTINQSIPCVSYQTICGILHESWRFLSSPRDTKVVSDGYLSLGAAEDQYNNVYTVVQEDADGTALKVTDQTNNAARAQQYDTSANSRSKRPETALSFDWDNILPTPASSADPSVAPPSARSVGISLLHGQRLSQLQKTLTMQARVQQPVAPQSPFYAEDLMLGIRIDVKHEDRIWRSLCERVSRYAIGDSGSAGVLQWSPDDANDDTVRGADEGFVSFGATQSDAGPHDKQTQLHQSLFTWVGWSMAVQKPDGAEPINPDATCSANPVVKIKPDYKLKSPARLPPLRFNHQYEVRCRVVDLAGNSVPCLPDGGDHVLKLDPAFSRHEPIRAPQILLTVPLDPVNAPSEQVDRMVARDGRDPEPRALVAPRESLRLAELHDLVNHSLPEDGAYRKQQLMQNGAFPSVEEARKNNWVPGGPIRKEESPTHLNDGLLLPLHSNWKVTNPYLPDPLAHYIRVKAFLVSDDPALSRHLEDGYIEIDPRDDWPNLLPVRVSLHAVNADDKPAVHFDNESRPPVIRVDVPARSDGHPPAKLGSPVRRRTKAAYGCVQ